MKYGNPAQIGDKVSVAAMGTRGDKRGWEVLPPPNTIQTGCFQGRKQSSLLNWAHLHPFPIGMFYITQRFSEKNGLPRSNG